MNLKDLIKNVRDAAKAFDQTGIFGPKDKEGTLDEACVEYLKFRGYRVAPPHEFSIKIKDLNDLIKYFYLLWNSKYPEKYTASHNLGKDRVIAKKFVDGRMAATGASRDYALDECGKIIKVIIDNVEEFKFQYDVSFSVLDQENMGWVTQKALNILNNQLDKEREIKIDRLQKEIIASQDDSDLGFRDIDYLLKKMEDENA
jgi:hypothetical protein